ncbi:MAG: hypothetical protein K8U57_21545 [Planctomycetes bacterium]|nr:hypothetical protein [Planctomycetota bacterium]
MTGNPDLSLVIGIPLIGVYFVILGLSFRDNWRLQAAIKKLSDPPSLYYRVTGVLPENVQAFQQCNPGHARFETFVRAVLANPHLLGCHDRVRKDFRRKRVEYPGMELFVSVYSVP